MIYMKSAILGLRKRETYDELINDINHDPIDKYPDRSASQTENSNYLSQLRGGFEEMILQNDSIMKQKQKEILLQEEAGSVAHSHHKHVINEERWRQHVPPAHEPEQEVFHTPLRVPVGEPESYGPDVSMSEARSRSNRKASQRNSPLIQEAPQEFNIGTPRSRSPRKAKFKIAHDVDNEAEQAHKMAIDDEEMKAQQEEDLREHYAEFVRLMLQEAQNQEIEDVMTGRGDKRRDEGANPKPAQPKAKTAAWTQSGTRWTKDEPIPKAPPPKPKGRPPNQPEAEPKAPPPKPKGRPPNQPEAEHEPRGPRGRPKSTPGSASTDTPYAKAKAKAEAAARNNPEEETRGKAKPVKKNVKPKHDTDLLVLDNFDEWNVKGRGFLVDQIHKRPGIKFSKTDAKKLNKKEMIEKLLRFDGKL